MICKKCIKNIDNCRKCKEMCIPCYNKCLLEKNPEYKKRVREQYKKYYKKNKEKVLEYMKKYQHENCITKNFYVCLGVCPVCGVKGSFRIHSKFNKKSNKYIDFSLNVNHNKYLNGKTIYFNTCYISIKKFPEYKCLIDDVKKGVRRNFTVCSLP